MGSSDEHSKIHKRIDDLGESTDRRFKSVRSSISRIRSDFHPVQRYFKERILDNQIDARIEAKQENKHIESEIDKGNISIPKEAIKIIIISLGVIGGLIAIIQTLVGV